MVGMKAAEVEAFSTFLTPEVGRQRFLGVNGGYWEDLVLLRRGFVCTNISFRLIVPASYIKNIEKKYSSL